MTTYRMLFAALLTAVALSACGGKEEAKVDAAPAAGQAAPAAAPAAEPAAPAAAPAAPAAEPAKPAS